MILSRQKKLDIQLIFQDQIENFVYVFIIMEAIVFLFVNAKKIYQFKRKHSEINKYLLCLENISGNFSPYSMKKKQD